MPKDWSRAMTEARARRIMLKPDPLGIPRNPLAVYLLCLCFISGITTFLGASASGPMDKALPDWVTVIWGLVLIHGSGATLTGMFWPGTVAAGLLMKRIGMFSLMVAAVMYSAVLLFAYGLPMLLTSGIVLGFGVACGVQYRVISTRIQAIIALSSAASSDG